MWDKSPPFPRPHPCVHTHTHTEPGERWGQSKGHGDLWLLSRCRGGFTQPIPDELRGWCGHLRPVPVPFRPVVSHPPWGRGLCRAPAEPWVRVGVPIRCPCRCVPPPPILKLHNPRGGPQFGLKKTWWELWGWRWRPKMPSIPKTEHRVSPQPLRPRFWVKTIKFLCSPRPFPPHETTGAACSWQLLGWEPCGMATAHPGRDSGGNWGLERAPGTPQSHRERARWVTLGPRSAPLSLSQPPPVASAAGRRILLLERHMEKPQGGDGSAGAIRGTCRAAGASG